MIRARIKKWLSSWGKESPEAMRSRDHAKSVRVTGVPIPDQPFSPNQPLRFDQAYGRVVNVAEIGTDEAAELVERALDNLCTCQADSKGIYTGMQPMGGQLMRVSFTCEHGSVWGADVTKAEAQKYVPVEKEEIVEKKIETESLFKVHRLNEEGMKKANSLQIIFEHALTNIEAFCGVDGREMAIVRTKLEEASFFAKKAMAKKPENQEK